LLRSFSIFSFALFLIVIAGCGGGADSVQPFVPQVGAGAPAASAAPPAPPDAVLPPATAKAIEHIEDSETWGHCTDCAAHPHDPSPPLAVWEFDRFQKTPSMDGSSTRFFVGGSAAYANALHWTKFGNQSQYRNFIYEFHVYASPESLKAQNLEFDLFQGVSGREYMFGSQCNYAKGVWQGWDGPSIKWVDFPSAPCKKFEPGKWTRVKWRLTRTEDNKLHYVSITVGDTTYKVDSYQPPVEKSSWADTLGVQFQQDLNLHADDYAIWIDKVTVWMW
jgi:hypothetical protein